MDAITRLQKLDPQRFTELCYMHLTITLDLNNAELEVLLEHDAECKPKKRYFGRKFKEKPASENSPLTPESISQIYQIIEYLGRDYNLEHEGLFRKSGSLSRQQELKALLNAGAILDFKNLDQYTIHDCAGVLKKFLSELPEPLLTEAHYSAYCQIAEMKKDDLPADQEDVVFKKQLKSIKLLLLLLPPDNYSLLKYLLLFLFQVKVAHKKNKMTSENLAKIFSPQLLCPKKMPPDEFMCNSSCMVKVIAFLIDNATLVFDPPLELVQDVKLCLKEVETRKCFQSNYTETEPIKTTVTFCTQTDGRDLEATNKALSELQEYVQKLPDSEKKRKLLKKFQKEKPNDENMEECGRKHFRSKSVGEALKKHLMKNATRNKNRFLKNFHHSSYDTLATRTSTSSLEQISSHKAKSMDALNVDKSPNVNNKQGALGRHWLRASKKIRSWHH